MTYLVKRGLFESIKESFMAKRPCIVMAMTIVTFAAILGIIRMIAHQNFVIMASGLLVEFAWLIGVILISLLLRVGNDQIKSAFRIYSPLMLVGFIVISFRIVLIPNDLVNLIFPPILLLCSLWQWNVITRHNKKVPRNDMIYTWISLAVFGTSTLCSWIGFTLLAVKIIIWWMMQLTCILSITCIKDWLDVYAKRKNLKHVPITDKWGFRFINQVLLPISGVLSYIIAIYWAADVFNMSDTTWMIFNKDYIKTSNFTASLYSVTQVACLYFLFKYINITANDLMRHHFEKQDPQSAASKIVMFKNVLQVIIWGVWLMIALNLFQVGKSWLLSYTYTMLEAIDGSVIAFQNAQLFSKNYKNMTRNHGYELDILEVGVAYGSNVKQVKKLLVENLSKLDCIYHEKGVKVVLKSFDDNCITLKVLVWVNVLTQYADDGIIMECIYDTLNEHGIEIPFPQREITIKNVTPEIPTKK